uniref:Uncharacterized protein n=1 Tax=Triticum urartu TaxID=4572 RepID=A0A8R7PTX8_TRIUA
MLRPPTHLPAAAATSQVQQHQAACYAAQRKETAQILAERRKRDCTVQQGQWIKSTLES